MRLATSRRNATRQIIVASAMLVASGALAVLITASEPQISALGLLVFAIAAVIVCVLDTEIRGS